MPSSLVQVGIDQLCEFESPQVRTRIIFFCCALIDLRVARGRELATNDEKSTISVSGTITRSSPADAKQNKHSIEYHRKIQNFSYYLPLENDANFGNHPDAVDIKIQPKSQDYLLKMQYFCNFSPGSFNIHPRPRRNTQRIRKGEGRWSSPPETFSRCNCPPKTFACSIRSSSAYVKHNKQTLKPCRRQAKQTFESMPPQNSKP